MTAPQRPGEFVALAAFLISLVALSIDAMLPLLPDIGAEFDVARENDAQLVVAILFLGLALGQIAYGPISDSTGRKPAIYSGLVIFIIGSLICAFAPGLEAMLAGRFLQGVGAAGPRIVTVAMVRDRYEGRPMARIMSAIMAVFIIVPAIAPMLGQAVALLAGWRAIFLALLAQAVLVLIWFAWRTPETLPKEIRRPFTATVILAAFRETLTNRIAAGYTIAAGLIFGAFVGYLVSAQQIFQSFGKVETFPLYFAGLALAVGAASLVNARLVMGIGMRRLTWRALQMLTLISTLYAAATFLWPTTLWAFMGWAALSFFCIGILFGNVNAMALEPLGHIAGAASAVIASITTFASLIGGALIGQAFDGTVTPLVAGFAVLSWASVAAMYWTERGQITPRAT